MIRVNYLIPMTFDKQNTDLPSYLDGLISGNQPNPSHQRSNNCLIRDAGEMITMFLSFPKECAPTL